MVVMSPVVPKVLLWDYSGVLAEELSHDVAELHPEFGLSRDSWCLLLDKFLREDDAWSKVERGEVSLDWFAETLSARALDAGGDRNPEVARYLWWGGKSAEGRVMRNALLAAIGKLGGRFTLGVATNNVLELRAHWIKTLPTGLFTHIFDSSELGHRKPEVGFWVKVEQLLGVNSAEIMLVDDRSENVSAAIARGWRAHLYTTESGCIRAVEGLIK